MMVLKSFKPLDIIAWAKANNYPYRFRKDEKYGWFSICLDVCYKGKWEPFCGVSKAISDFTKQFVTHPKLP